MATLLTKEDDYTLKAVTRTPEGGTLTRYFNFEAEQVTTLYERSADREKVIAKNYHDDPAAAAVSVALASQLTVQKFSDFDSQREIERMREELLRQDGHPPESEGKLGKKPAAPAKLANA